MTTIYDLPKATTVDLERSKALSNSLRQAIEHAGGLISFATFMEASLYHATFGYYNADTFSLGARGDFTTAPIISPLFAKCFARQSQQLLPRLLKPQMLEIGAGTGHFACDLLHELKKLSALPDYYYIYEISLNLRKKQQDFLKTACPEFFSRIIWLNELPTDFTGLIIANEVLDALPVHCFCIQNNEIKERCVAWEKDQFTWQLSQPLVPELLEKTSIIQKKYQLSEGYASEINLSAEAFMQAIANCLASGVILLADYGYGERMYYHPERRSGSLTCFYKHRHHDNPLLMPGLQDITAHVNFTNVIESAHANGYELAGYTSQAAFLLNLGLIEIAEAEEKSLSTAEQFELRQAIKLLTLPTEMGERVKIMALSKGLEANQMPLLGFQWQDRRWDL